MTDLPYQISKHSTIYSDYRVTDQLEKQKKGSLQKKYTSLVNKYMKRCLISHTNYIKQWLRSGVGTMVSEPNPVHCLFLCSWQAKNVFYKKKIKRTQKERNQR